MINPYEVSVTEALREISGTDFARGVWDHLIERHQTEADWIEEYERLTTARVWCGYEGLKNIEAWERVMLRPVYVNEGTGQVFGYSDYVGYKEASHA